MHKFGLGGEDKLTGGGIEEIILDIYSSRKGAQFSSALFGFFDPHGHFLNSRNSCNNVFL